ncbi:MAG TPA: carbohydrate ABC transporter permease [Candidatus Faecivivens stercoripullorum]|uniref:Carbohydrate ABC transporter permease n=1 Tax=Candidatus Faecivivens stercoripullorum TaxID=2840805 RepID=A0A9D1H6S4_9FIRM|nr:carbohydrate ABC transporter permease [Candidatus Faecivivens stercoripullorum]
MSKSADKTAGIVGVKESVGDHVFNILNTILMILISVVIVYPLWYVILASITDPAIVNSGKFLLLPQGFYVAGYQEAFDYPQIWAGYKNSIIYTVVGVIVALVATIPGAYALSRRDMAGRKGIMFLFTFTMFFNGGMIPLFLTVQNVNIYNTMWAIVLPIGVSVYNLIVCRSFFEANLPIELLEASKLDGCSDFGFFFKIAIPLSSTIIAVMVLFYATGLWNIYFNAIMFLRDEDKMPLQVVLRNLILSNQLMQGASGAELVEKQKLVDQLKYVIVTLAAFPLVIVYPFVQKYFAKGVMVGAVKG